MKKRALSLALSLTMCLGLMTVPALAVASVEVVKSYEDSREVAAATYSEGMRAISPNGYTGWAFVDGSGNTVIEGPYHSVGAFSEGLAAANPEYYYTKDNQGWGYIDKTGKWVIEPQFASAGAFRDGVARVQDKETGNWGAIDKTGKVVVPFEYGKNLDGIYLREAFDGMIRAYHSADAYWGYYDTTGRVAIPFQFTKAEDFHAGCARVWLNHRYTYIDKTGRDIIPQQYTDVEQVKVDGKPAGLLRAYNSAAYSEKNYIYLLNGNGQEVAGPYHELGSEFSCGLTPVCRIDGKNYLYGYINTTGQEVIPCGQYTELKSFQNGYALVSTAGSGDPRDRQVIINTAGQIVMTLPRVEGREYGTFSEGLMPVSSRESGRERWGVMNPSGQLVVDYKYQSVGAFSGGFAVVENFDRQHGLINTAGQEVVPCKYVSIGEFINGVALVGEKGTYRTLYGLLNTAGQEILPCHYEQGVGEAVIPALESGDKDVCAVVNTYSGNQNHYFLVHITTDPTAQPAAPVTPVQPVTSAANTAYASTQTVLVDGKAVEFRCYALKDANGNDTNYIKLRDIASILNGTAVQFQVGWNGAVNIETGKAYTANGSEMSTPFSGNRGYETAAAATNVNGQPAALEAIVLKDDKGGAYTYYKLRDLGTALGFRVDWSAEKGIFIETK